MGYSFAKPSEFTGGAVFKPGNHMNDLALLIEPTRIDRGVSHTYNGKTTARDEVTATITVFGTSESLERGAPSAELAAVRVVHGMLTATLDRVMGAAMVAVVRKVPTQAGSGFVFRDVDSATEAAVGRYFEQREQAVADALTSGAMPSFDDAADSAYGTAA